MGKKDPFGAVQFLSTASGPVRYVRLSRLSELKIGEVDRLPFSIKILLESLVRHVDGSLITSDDVARLAAWDPYKPSSIDIPFKPGRVILQDFTGVPCLVDLAALRGALHRAGGDPRRINPQIPCDLVIDHSIQVDAYGSRQALGINSKIEFDRNHERYEFLRWGAQAFSDFQLVPPNTGIVHQVNLEYLAHVVMATKDGTETIVFPDSVLGTDSHTTMINGLGVLGWGVGGIEAEATMLGQPMYMLPPPVIGFKLSGKLREGATATDLVLTVTQLLRAKGVVNKFIEFFGPGLSSLSLPDRATIANMCPEYGATSAYFPVDHETLNYLKMTGRSDGLIDLVERYTKEQGLFRTDSTPVPVFTEIIELQLESIESSLAGPKRPQDRVSLSESKEGFRKVLGAAFPVNKDIHVPVELPTGQEKIGHGSVVIAAITSCTNTSNPSVMVGAGLLAKKAVEKGLTVKPFVKTSLAPGSQVVTDYLDKAGLTPYLEKLGFFTVGYGCTTCIGNSGPLIESVSKAVKENDLLVASVLSGNRNFEGRIHPQVKANYLASPLLVVAYAIAGTMDIDLTKEPLGKSPEGTNVFLKEIWPTQKEISQAMAHSITADTFKTRYAVISEGTPEWKSIPTPVGDLYTWNPKSTYVQEPPFLLHFSKESSPIQPIQQARVLVMVGDSVTTDHISPAGSIAKESPAGQYLIAQGVEQKDFNSYGARRGNDRVMTRGTFANVRLKNLMAPGTEGWWTTTVPEGERMSIFDASLHYQKKNVPLLVLAGKEYGSGSSRDWAAKGPALLGVKAVIAESFERIHRSNLVGMGILPLEFLPGDSAKKLGLTGWESFDVVGLSDRLEQSQLIEVKAASPEGKQISFMTKVRIDMPVEMEYYRHGGILPYVLRKFLS